MRLRFVFDFMNGSCLILYNVYRRTMLYTTFVRIATNGKRLLRKKKFLVSDFSLLSVDTDFDILFVVWLSFLYSPHFVKSFYSATCIFNSVTSRTRERRCLERRGFESPSSCVINHDIRADSVYSAVMDT